MNIRKAISFAIALGVSAASITGIVFATNPTPAAAQGNDPRAVVKAYLDALAARKLDAAIAQVADDVTHTDTHPPPGVPGLTQGKAGLRAYLKNNTDDPSYRLQYADLQAKGDTVTWTAKESFDVNNLPPNFPLPIESHLQAVVANGKIKSILLDNDPAWLEKLYASIPPEAIDPVSVVQLWARAENAHDLDKILAYFAGDATVTDANPAPGSKSVLKGTTDLRALFEKDVKSNARLELSDFAVPEPDHVKFVSKYWADPGALPANYPLPIVSNVDALVKDGKITALTIDDTPEWLAKAAASNLVGTWKIKVPKSQGGFEAFEALHTFNADGTFVETSSLLGTGTEGPAHGVWACKGKDCKLTFQLFTFDKGKNNGMAQVRCSILPTSADSLTANCAVDVIGLDGKVQKDVDKTPFDGVRVKVEDAPAVD
jgi:ketosteroid isomerase-like protein